jgi:sterol desaturase/sphingolipid hydroxylase (fatty acid hydroxylase superfamily)
MNCSFSDNPTLLSLNLNLSDELMKTVDSISMPAFTTAILLSISLILGYYITGLMIAMKDVSGEWKSFDLRNSGTNSQPPRTWAMYATHTWDHARDLLFFLPVGIYIVALTREQDLWWVASEKEVHSYWMKQVFWYCCVYILQNLWLFFFHYFLHSKYLYNAIHKYHHVSLDYTHALSAWADSIWEYLFMELGSYLICMALLPAHTYTWIVFMFFLGYSSSVKHSG